MITWEIKKNEDGELIDQELESFDTKIDPKIFWDGSGHAYFTEDKYVTITTQGLRMTTYDVEKINRPSASQVKQRFGYHLGCRFDYVNHSWLYLREFVALPYSYMTFVIINQVEEENDNYINEDYYFDLEHYNYLFNGKTAFLNDKNLVNDYEKLIYVLKNFETIDPALLEQLQYYTVEKEMDDDEEENDPNAKVTTKMITPLHIAYQERNNRSVKVLLTYMSKLHFNSSQAYKDILPDLIDYNGFVDYLTELPFQTT